jgi:hypothetical protein
MEIDCTLYCSMVHYNVYSKNYNMQLHALPLPFIYNLYSHPDPLLFSNFGEVFFLASRFVVLSCFKQVILTACHIGI